MKRSKLIVVKVGSNVLTCVDGTLDEGVITNLVSQIADLKRDGYGVVLVSSGAVAAGQSILQHKLKAQDKIYRRQVLASVGQPKLINTYLHSFAKHDLHVGQILATKEDFRDRKHYLNMRTCVYALLRENVVPIVNENDVISIEELMFTDNDELAGLVASMIDATDLVILTNVDGIFDGDPSDAESQIIERIDESTQRSINLTFKKSTLGRGGMHTKYRVSLKLAKMGVNVFIGNGKTKENLKAILQDNALCTHFPPKGKVSNVKKWLAYQNDQHRGCIIVNDGAVRALTNQGARSLLPIGITDLNGSFEKGDVVTIIDQRGNQIGLGIAQYGYQSAHKSMGQKGKRALVHYDYLIIV